MRQFSKRIGYLHLAVVFILLFAAAGYGAAKDIVVLFTNDAHCGITNGMGYAGVASYKEYMKTGNNYVTLVDAGDAVQGDVMGSVSKGHSIIEIMNACGYEICTLGNHEFDYGLVVLDELLDESKAQYVACNISYSGSGENMLDGIKPYVIKKYGGTKVAFIGVATPASLSTSTPVFFMEDDVFVYDFKEGNNGQDLYACVQDNINRARKEGAKYVVLLTHLGDTPENAPYSSVDVIRNTTGADAVLDGHAHTVLPCRVEKNKEGRNVLLCSTGTKLANIGQLTISPSGTITAGIITHYEDKDPAVTAVIDKVKADNDRLLEQPVTELASPISDSDSEGRRLVRCRETGLGNLVADSSRSHFGGDVALVNGGGLRTALPQGTITYSNILAVLPFGNTHCLIKATGQQILDALEFTSRYTEAEYFNGKELVGENGAFLHVSGMKYTIDTSIPSSVKTDDKGMFVAVEGARRVTDVMIEKNGSWVPLDPNAEYKVAGVSYALLESGDGLNVFANCERLADDGILDTEVLIEYLSKLDGKLDRYYQPEGRITIK